MTDSSQPQVDLVVRTIAQTAVDNEKYFGDLDAVVGDGDFGYSLARGFEMVLSGWDEIDLGLGRVGHALSPEAAGVGAPMQARKSSRVM